MIVRFARESQPFTSVVAWPKRGKRFQALLTGRQRYRTPDTMTSAEDGAPTVPVWVARYYNV